MLSLLARPQQDGASVPGILRGLNVTRGFEDFVVFDGALDFGWSALLGAPCSEHGGGASDCSRFGGFSFKRRPEGFVTFEGASGFGGLS